MERRVAWRGDGGTERSGLSRAVIAAAPLLHERPLRQGRDVTSAVGSCSGRRFGHSIYRGCRQVSDVHDYSLDAGLRCFCKSEKDTSAVRSKWSNFFSILIFASITRVILRSLVLLLRYEVYNFVVVYKI